MSSCFRNCLSICKKKDSHGKQEGESTKKPVVIGGHTHPFDYHERKRKGSTYKCNGCQETGFGPYYHKRCGDMLRLESPPVSNHHPYPIGHYIFKERAPSKVRCCIACGDQVRGLRYKVQRSRWFRNKAIFHPLRTLLPPQIQDAGERKFQLKLEERMRGKCPICEGEAKGWAYNSTSGGYCYHAGCVKNKIIQSWQQDKASENGGNDRGITINVEIQMPQIQELVEDIFTVLFHWIPIRCHSG